MLTSPTVRLITRKWRPAVGGMETYSAKIAEGLRERENLDVIALAGRSSGREPSAFALVGFGLATALKLLVAGEAAVVHVTDLASWPLAWVATARHPRSRIVVSAHGSDVSFAGRPGWRGALYHAYLRTGARVLKRARIIANSRYIAELTRRQGFERISIVPLATDLVAQGENQHRQGLFYAGRINKAKGLRFLAEQVFPLLPTEIRLRVAGAIWEESERALLSHPRVDYLGVLSQQELADEFARSTAVLIPTRDSEGFGLVAIEAAACGAWVIASNHSGLSEVVTPPIGVAVDADDPEEWAAAIRAALSKSDDARRTDALAAIAEVDRRYRWPRVIDETIAVFQE